MNVGSTPIFNSPADDRRSAMMVKAQELEATFLAEMLGHAELGKTSEEFGGGAGEEQFASFLQHEYSRMIVKEGGFGLAEMIFNSMGGGPTNHGQ